MDAQIAAALDVLVLRTAIWDEIHRLDRPKGLHQYKRGLHCSPCLACEMRSRLLKALGEEKS